MNIMLYKIWSDPELNCRGEVTPESVAELASSMKAQGLLQPILVIPQDSGMYSWKIVAGHRRFAAAEVLRWDTIPCIRLLAAKLNDHECRKANLQENMARKDLTPSQEMRAIVAIYGDEPADRGEVAKDLGMSRKWVNDRLRLRTMEKRILDKVDDGLLGALDLQYLCSAHPEERWNLAKRMMSSKAEGVSSTVVARKAKLRRRARGMKEIRRAKTALESLGRSPHWIESLDWCSGDLSTEDFFGVPLDKLADYGILE